MSIQGQSFRFEKNSGFATVGASSTDEAVIAELEIPPGFVEDNDRVDVNALPTSPTQNSTDTHRFRLRLGSLTGPAIADSGAVDAGTDDVKHLNAWLKCLVAGGPSVAQVAGSGSGSVGHKGAAAATYQTTGANGLKLVLTGQAGASSAGNTMTGIDLHAIVHKALPA